MVCAAGFDPVRLFRTGLAGCVGGSWLVSVDGKGRLAGCSFDTAGSRLGWEQLGTRGVMDHFTRWVERAPRPCSSCRWLPVCRGGCHVVARHVTGSFFAPDPGCPIVNRFQRGF
jgi:radical SAM protein with 4Fe4S-binding SPASM domain